MTEKNKTLQTLKKKCAKNRQKQLLLTLKLSKQAGKRSKLESLSGKIDSEDVGAPSNFPKEENSLFDRRKSQEEMTTTEDSLIQLLMNYRGEKRRLNEENQELQLSYKKANVSQLI